MAKRVRDLKKEAGWRKLVSAQQRSGQTVRQYCQENGLAESAFWFWKRELARRDAEKPARHPGGRSSARRNQPARRLPSLVPVTIGPALPHAASVEVLLARGVSVRVGAGCDEATLRMVLAALERAS
jgi:transposase